MFLSFNVLEYLFALGREPHTSDFWDMSLKSTLWEIRCYLQTEPGSLSKLENLIYFVGCVMIVCISQNATSFPGVENDGRGNPPHHDSAALV